MPSHAATPCRKPLCTCPILQNSHNCGVLYPLDDFHELLKAKVGDVCAAELQIESAAEMHRRATAPEPKKKAVFQPKANSVKDDFLAKLRLHRKRYGW